MNKRSFFTLTFFNLGFLLLLTAQIPDTLTNRYATTEDAAYWHNVNIGDYIFFQGNIANGTAIYAGGTVFRVKLELGKKILIWRGDYLRIYIDGELCPSTEEQPTIITNLGGQVRWGNSDKQDNKRTLEIANFEHVMVSGKYNPEMQTGNIDFKGHNKGEDYTNPEYYKNYGLWGNPRWSGYRYYGKFSNIVRIRGFKTCKVEYVAATEGGFAGFNIKTDGPTEPGKVKIDIQDCFAGWTESEGYYISYSSSSEGQDITALIFKNNIAAFCGSESFQTDNLASGTVIENNIAFAGACFHRRPFQDKFQDGLHQFSFVEGGVLVQNNILITGNSLHQLRYKFPGEGRVSPFEDKKVVMKNNYYGFARSNISYIWEGDGITPYEIDGNIYGPVSTPSTRDAYNGDQAGKDYIKICNLSNPISYKNIIYPSGRGFFNQHDCGYSTNVDTINLMQKDAPVVQFVNSGFSNDMDYRNITFWSADYQTKDKDSEFIPYKTDDIVYYYDTNGVTSFYKCIKEHAANHDPNDSHEYWEKLSWEGHNLPPLDLRQKVNSFYDTKNIGLTYKENTVYVASNNEIPVLKVYPNPATNQVTLQFPENFTEQYIHFTIINLTGKTIYQNTIERAGNTNTIGLHNLDNGFYILEAGNGNNVVKTKLLIEN